MRETSGASNGHAGASVQWRCRGRSPATLRGRDGATVRVLVTSRTIEAPKGILDKAGAIVFLELGELARKQQRSVHVRLLSVR